MTAPMEITASSNKRIKHLMALIQKRKARQEEGCFVAEGEHLFAEVPDRLLREIYVARSFYQSSREAVDGKDKPVYVLEDRLFDKVSDTKSPQGILCVAAVPQWDAGQLISLDAPLFLLLDEIRDPGNLGTMIRTGEAAGIDGIWLLPGCADPYQPKVVRSAMGALYRVPVLEEKPEELLRRWKDKGIRLYGSSLDASLSYDAPDYRHPTAFVIGNESRGISDEMLSQCDERIIIPMKGQVESLNAAIAASLMMFEAARQRRM